MTVTLREMVTQARLDLKGPDRDVYATFDGWLPASGLPKTGFKLTDLTDKYATHALVELDTELLYCTSVDTGGTATCPAWFRQQDGTPANDDYTAGGRVTIRPSWPTYRLAQKVCEGITALYPDLFGVAEVELTTSPIVSSYELPSDCDGVLKVEMEQDAVSQTRLPIWGWSFDPGDVDGSKWLRTYSFFPRPMFVTYKRRPVVPSPADLDATWGSTGLPESAADLAVLYAVMRLLPTADASKLQTQSVEQSDRNRLVQSGSANAASRRIQELYVARLADERRKLRDLYPVRSHRRIA